MPSRNTTFSQPLQRLWTEGRWVFFIQNSLFFIFFLFFFFGMLFFFFLSHSLTVFLSSSSFLFPSLFLFLPLPLPLSPPCSFAQVISIAHRLSTIRTADRIAVLKDGVVIEEGTFDNLSSKKEGGAFRDLMQRQLTGSWAAYISHVCTHLDFKSFQVLPL